MPTANQILNGLQQTANTWKAVSVFWNIYFGVFAVVLAIGIRPSKRIAGLLLGLPFLSVSAIKQPGRFRFVYSKPERKEFVSDGERIYSYLVADRQVIVSPAPQPGEGTTPALFLAGQANIVQDYTASLAPLAGAAPGLVTLKLEPKIADPDYQWFGIGVDPRTLQIRHLVAVDRNGGRSSFAFTNLKENRGVPDNTFRFRIPRGVDVVTNGTPSR